MSLEYAVRLPEGKWLFALFLLACSSLVKMALFQWGLCDGDHDVGFLVVEVGVAYHNKQAGCSLPAGLTVTAAYLSNRKAQ